jgi:hypothetical protein
LAKAPIAEKLQISEYIIFFERLGLTIFTLNVKKCMIWKGEKSVLEQPILREGEIGFILCCPSVVEVTVS